MCVRKIVSTNDHLEILASFTGLGDGAAHGVQNTRRKPGRFYHTNDINVYSTSPPWKY